MTQLTTPLYCLTSDVEWASDYVVRQFLEIIADYGIRPTLFATHPSRVLEEAHARGAIELGIHPNFLPGSSHGSDHLSVIECMCRMFPHASTFRSHCFYDNTQVTREFVRRGFKYDSNLCLFLQPQLVPLRHQSGLVRFPVFWEDDVHWSNTGGDWNFDRYISDFTTPGLKILNVHPFVLTANIPNDAYYQTVKKHISTLDADLSETVRHRGEGVQTFLLKLLEFLSNRGERFYTLAELHRLFPVKNERTITDDSAGRQTAHSDEEHAKYWSLSDRAKQEFVWRDFEQRNPTDPYATSRDYNARELEIDSIKRHLGGKANVLDLGCGNGYTLLSVAKEFEGCELVGIDFSENLIKGAQSMLEDGKHQLLSIPRFICADAMEYVKNCGDAEVDYIITERFLQNLPSTESQYETIRQVYRVLAPGGCLLMCEGSEDGFENLNDLRAAMGLSRVPATSSDNISAIRFRDRDVEAFALNAGFVLKAKVGYSTYMIIARVLHPLLVAPLAPRFNAKINDLAGQIQKHIPYQPGHGSNVLWVFEKPRKASSEHRS
jgi:SAM-dependent methyltransferase